jgi:hypothetical protein
MFGCLRRLSFLGLVLLVVVGWFTRDAWLPVARSLVGRDTQVVEDTTVPTWQTLDQAQAERGERAVRALAGKSGPVYVNLRAGELASYAFLSLAANSLPAALNDAQAAVIGDRVYLKTEVSPQDFAGALGGAGGLGGLFATRDTLRLGGTFEVLRPGLAQFRVRDLQLGTFPLPAAAIPRLLARVRGRNVPEGLAADALPVQIPEYIGDVRIARGRVTLYRATP